MGIRLNSDLFSREIMKVTTAFTEELNSNDTGERRGQKRKFQDLQDATNNNNYNRKKFPSNHPFVSPEQRLSVYNMSIGKINRSRNLSEPRRYEPSLRHSVLVLNTLRLIEREMEREGLKLQTVTPVISTDEKVMTLDPPPPTHAPHTFVPVLSGDGGVLSISASPMDTSEVYEGGESSSSSSSDEDSSEEDSGLSGVVNCKFQGFSYSYNTSAGVYERPFAELESPSGRATPFPCETTCDDRLLDSSSWTDMESENRLSNINWSSVLSFTSQNSGEMESNPYHHHPHLDDTNSSSSSNEASPNTSPSSDSGISTGSYEIFGDIDVSLYDFDVFPLSPPSGSRNFTLQPGNTALSAEELLRTFPSEATTAPSPLAAAPTPPRFRSELGNATEDLDNIMHMLVGI